MKAVSQIVIVSVLAAGSVSASAQSIRGGKWEVTLQPIYMESQTVSAGNGSKADIDSAWGFGFGVAYNLNDNFSIGGDFSWSSADSIRACRSEMRLSWSPDWASTGSRISSAAELSAPEDIAHCSSASRAPMWLGSSATICR